MFLLDNSLVLLGILVLLFFSYQFYNEYYIVKETPDDWLEGVMLFNLKKEEKKKFLGFIDKPIKIGSDSHTVERVGFNHYERKAK
jgi:hypothetical protein